MAVTVSLKDLIESGAHFGHQTRRWNPKMEEYLYGSRDGVHIFDLTKTKEKLDEVLSLLKKSAKNNETILFVGTKKQIKEKIKEVAKATDSFYINERWLGGLLTNFDQVKRSSVKLTDMKEKMAKGAYLDRTKKERVILEREIDRLERFFSGLVGLTKIPEIVIVVDIKRESGAVYESNALGATTIGIVDSNSDPTDVDFAIPMNDDASKALEYVVELMGDAILEGKGKLKSTEDKVVENKEEKRELEKTIKAKKKDSPKKEKKSAKKIIKKEDDNKKAKKEVKVKKEKNK